MMEEKVGFLTANKDIFSILGLSLLVLAIYFQTTGFGFLNLDDNLYVYDNGVIKRGLNAETLKWAFNAFWAANWHPLTWLSHALDVQIFGLNPGLHHAVNIVLHLLNSILAFGVFRRATGMHWESLAVAVLFAVHPAHVESVAWISERKDVLSTLFWLATMLAYLKYVQSKPTENESIRDQFRNYSSPWYLLTLGLFVLGLLTKPMLVTLPFVLLLLDHWPLKRLASIKDIWTLIVEKIPLLVLSSVSCVITIFAQRSSGAIESFDYLPLATRIANATVSYAKYVIMFFYPANLAVWYPYETELPVWQVAGAAALLLLISAVCIWQIYRRPFLIVGWLWFLGTLVPVIGIVQVGSQAMADRYTYVAYFGLFIMLVWGVAGFALENRRVKQLVPYSAAAIILALTGVAWNQTRYWRDNETLYRRTLDVTTNNHLISHNLCHHYVMQDRLEGAERYCQDAIEIKPNYYESYNTLGIVYFKRSQFAEAESKFKEVLKYAPHYVYAHLNLAQALSRQGKAEEAEESLRKAVEGSGSPVTNVFSAALKDIANVYEEQGKYDKAADNLRRLIYIQPDDAWARARLAFVLYRSNKLDQAEREVDNALSVNPSDAATQNIAGAIRLKQGRPDLARKHFERALELEPDNEEARRNLALLRDAKTK